MNTDGYALPALSEILLKKLCASLTLPYAYCCMKSFLDRFTAAKGLYVADTSRLQSRICGSLHNLSRLADIGPTVSDKLLPTVLPSDLDAPFKSGGIRGMVQSALQASEKGLTSSIMSEALSSVAVVQRETTQTQSNQDGYDYAIYGEAMLSKLVAYFHKQLPDDQTKRLNSNKYLFNCDADRLESLVTSACVCSLLFINGESTHIDTVGLRYHPDWPFIYEAINRFHKRIPNIDNPQALSMVELSHEVFGDISEINRLLMPTAVPKELRDLFSSFYDKDALFGLVAPVSATQEPTVSEDCLQERSGQ